MTPMDGARETINLLLISGAEHWIAVAAEEGALLADGPTADGDGSTPPRLLRAAGIDETGYPDEEVVLVLPDGGRPGTRWALPRPDELLPSPARSLQPICPLIAEHMRIRGAIGFVSHLDRPVVILDPRLLSPESEEDRAGDEGAGGLAP